MREIKISIVMNCYNGAQHLREAIESILIQSYKNWELVFWDNRSTDESASITLGYEDPRIRYFLALTHTNLGTARALAVNECLGDYISFLDTDDLYLQDNLRKKLQAIENEEAEVVYGGVIEIRKDGSEYNRFLPKNRSGFLLKNLLMQFEIDVATMMVKRSALIVGRINFDGRIYGSEEYDLMLRMAVNSKFAVIHDHIAKMRVHHGSLSNSVMDKWAQDRRLTLGTILLEHPNLKNQYKNEFQEAFARANYYEARWLVHQGNVLGAISLLWNVKYVNWRYLGLYLVLRISPKLWNLLHKFLRRSRQ